MPAALDNKRAVVGAVRKLEPDLPEATIIAVLQDAARIIPA